MTKHKAFRSLLSASLLLAAFSVLLLLLLFHLEPASAQSGGKKAAAEKGKLSLSKPVVGRAVKSAKTRPVRELPAYHDGVTDPEALKRFREINKLNTRFIRKPNPNAKEQKDGALQSSWTPRRGFQFNVPATPAIPAPSLTFEGIPVQNSAPPDTTGAVGPNHYVQTVNSTLVGVWDKNGNLLTPFFSLSSLFGAVGGVCASNDQGDPIVLYDRMADRWMISQFAFANFTAPPYHQCIAVSKNGDPTGEYWAYDFITPGNEFPDYPKFGAWPDAYYYTDRQFTNGGPYNGFGVFAFDRAKMLVGDPTASFIYFNAGPDLSKASSGMLPTDFYGLTPPPPGAPNLFSVFLDDAFDDEDALRLFDFHADFATPGNSTFTERAESPLPVAAFDSRDTVTRPIDGRNDIEQPPPATTADALNAIGDRLMLRLFYINRGGTEMLTTVHTVNAGVIPPVPGFGPTITEYEAATRHYILQKTTPGGAWSVLDQATFSPDSTERWMGSSALDNAGNLAVGYSTSSTSVFPSLAYAGRLLTDPPNTLAQGEATMFAGTGVQRGTGSRWGDYSNMSLDPADDCTFWYTSEYYTSTNLDFNWQTRIGRFNLGPGTCTAPAQGTLSGAITACDTGAPLADAVVQVSGGPSAGFSGTTKPDGNYSFKLAPGTYSVTISDPAHECNSAGPFNVVITNGGTTTQNGCLSGDTKFLFESAAVSGGDGDGKIEANECNNLNVTALNDGCLTGSSVTSVLSTTTPGVSIVQPNSAFPNTPVNVTSTNSIPFIVSTSNTFVCGTEIDFTLALTFNGGTSTISFSLPSCEAPTATVNGSLAAGDATQDGRLGRNAVTSNCGAAKACPGPFGPGAPRRFDTHSFQNGPSPACVTITTTTSCPIPANAIIAAAYLGSYNPADLCQNYLGDPGASDAVISFQVDVPANGNLIVVVQEANSLAGCGGYTVDVDGLVGNSGGNGFCGAPSTVVSRKTHGSGGTGPEFDVNLPLFGPDGIECRTGGPTGDHQLVFTFPGPVTVTGTPQADVTSGIGDIGNGGVADPTGTVNVAGSEVTVPLTNVANAQTITVTLFGVNNGTNTFNVAVPMGVLLGDVNSTGRVTIADTGLTKGQALKPLTDANFRMDVNTSGNITTADTNLVKSKALTSLP